MNKIKQLTVTIFMILGIMMSMTSCSKDTPKESVADIVGSWQLVKGEFFFDGELMETMDMEDDEEVLVFTKDGRMFFDDDYDDDESEYLYSPKSKELTIIDSYGQEVVTLDRLTSSELVVSETISDIFGFDNFIDYSSIGDAVDRFNGANIYEYDADGERLYCYKKGGKYYLCDELEGGGYYDFQTIYYKRIK